MKRIIMVMLALIKHLFSSQEPYLILIAVAIIAKINSGAKNRENKERVSETSDTPQFVDRQSITNYELGEHLERIYGAYRPSKSENLYHKIEKHHNRFLSLFERIKVIGNTQALESFEEIYDSLIVAMWSESDESDDEVYEEFLEGLAEVRVFLLSIKEKSETEIRRLKSDRMKDTAREIREEMEEFEKEEVLNFETPSPKLTERLKILMKRNLRVGLKLINEMINRETTPYPEEKCQSISFLIEEVEELRDKHCCGKIPIHNNLIKRLKTLKDIINEEVSFTKEKG